MRSTINNRSRKYGVRLAVLALFGMVTIYSAEVKRPAVLQVTIYDAATGKPTPVRVAIQDEHGNRPRARGATMISESPIPIPKQAIPVMWGTNDHAEGNLLQPDSSFYVDGKFDLSLPPGEYTLTISKGYEYEQQTHALSLGSGRHVKVAYHLQRWIDMPQRGWYSSDDHIHLRRSPRDDHAILLWAAAEDVHVGNILQMGDFWTSVFTQYAFGKDGRYQEGGNILSSGQEEPRTPEIGHAIGLGASAFVRFQNDYYSYDEVFDQVRALGGVAGFAHQGFSFHGYRGMTLNVLRGKVDFLELCQFCVPEGPLALDHYYHFLDLGYKLTATAGSDFPWCGRGPRYGFPGKDTPQIGNARFYSFVGGPLSFEHWLGAVKAGHTFVTTGPMLFLKVNECFPGDTLDVAPGQTVHITVEAYGQHEQIPLSSLEIVGHGKILKRVEGQGTDQLSAEMDLPIEHGIWIAAKCEAGKGQVAHTTPVYVTVNSGGFWNPETAPRYLQLSEKYLQELEEELANPGKQLDSQAARHKAELERQIAEARTVLTRLAETIK
jgi:hypothetical protein